jgi:YVTN family beta-propeller protein
MTPRIFGSIAAFLVCFLLGGVCLAQNAYIPNSGDNTVSVINTATNLVIATIPVGNSPEGVKRKLLRSSSAEWERSSV